MKVKFLSLGQLLIILVMCGFAALIFTGCASSAYSPFESFSLGLKSAQRCSL